MMKTQEREKPTTTLAHGPQHDLTDDDLTDELASELLNVDFSSTPVPSALMHSEWKSLLQFTQVKINEELGPEFKLSKDLCEYSFYAFPHLSFELLSCILICNMAVWVLDDHLLHFPNGKIVLSSLVFSVQLICFIYRSWQRDSTIQNQKIPWERIRRKMVAALYEGMPRSNERDWIRPIPG